MKRGEKVKLLSGDCLTHLKKMESNSIDSMITDPPAGIAFMGKKWDDDKGGREQWIAWMKDVMEECLRALKPGAHALVWAIPRTSHWTATALENAGFEIRDVITHLFGSGFPKSLDISKAIDKAAGNEREVIGRQNYSAPDIRGNSYDQAHVSERERLGVPITAPGSKEAEAWQGWGTALKPASEHWILVRKPLSEKTVAANTLLHGTGGINIDGCRVSGADSNWTRDTRGQASITKNTYGKYENILKEGSKQGRFPANLVLSHSIYCSEKQCDIECAVLQLDAQSGVSKSIAPKKSDNRLVEKAGDSLQLGKAGIHNPENSYTDSGGASRFFYCAKASKSERNLGCEGLPEVEAGIGDDRPSGQSMQRLDGRETRKMLNFHPTVKPLKLMRYLIRLVTPSGGIVLDPFMGSGSTGVAAAQEGFRFVGIEREPEYIEIAEARIAAIPVSV